MVTPFSMCTVPVERKTCQHHIIPTMHKFPFFRLLLSLVSSLLFVPAFYCDFFPVQVWDARSHQLLQHYPAHDGEVTSISFHHSGNFLLSSSTDSSLKVRLVFFFFFSNFSVSPYGRLPKPLLESSRGCLGQASWHDSDFFCSCFFSLSFFQGSIPAVLVAMRVNCDPRKKAKASTGRLLRVNYALNYTSAHTALEERWHGVEILKIACGTQL